MCVRLNTVSLFVACTTVVAALGVRVAASCWQQDQSTNCCNTVDSFDSVGNCSPWFHECPDQAISDPAILQVVARLSGKSGFGIQEFTCRYQPKKCQFIGCDDDGEEATAGCTSDTPSGDSCGGTNGGGIVPAPNPVPPFQPVQP